MTTTAAHARDGGQAGDVHDRPAETDPLTVRALARGLSILSLFDVDHRQWTIDEIAARTGLLRMTAYRMVRTLEAAEFLVRDATTNQYHLGPATIAMAYVVEDYSEFVEHARPFLEELLEATGESVTLAVPVDGTPVSVEHHRLHPSVPARGRPGAHHRRPGLRARQDLHRLRHAGEARRSARADRRQHTPYTVTDPAALADELGACQEEDVAYDLEGLFPNICAVGSPVRDQLGTVVAAMSVVMPTGRFGPEERDLCTQAVKVRPPHSPPTSAGTHPGRLPCHLIDVPPQGRLR